MNFLSSHKAINSMQLFKDHTRQLFHPFVCYMTIKRNNMSFSSEPSKWSFPIYSSDDPIYLKVFVNGLSHEINIHPSNPIIRLNKAAIWKF